jgi:large subunit ribosomal protein L1
MAKHGKRYRDALKKAPKNPVVIEEAIDFMKANAGANFDETVEIAFRLGVDPTKSDQMVRGTVSLPHGSGRTVRVAVFASGAQADAAREVGADEVGYEDLLEKVKGGWTDFDVAIATTDAMQEVRKLGRVLGPRGLMPNPRTGTVTDDVGPAVVAAKGGRVEFRMDRTGNISLRCGKRSFEKQQLLDNILAVIRAVQAERPASARGVFLRTGTVSTSMGVGIPIIIPSKD